MDGERMEMSRGWSLVLGICLGALGLLVMSFAFYTTFFTLYILGIAVAVRGIIDIVMSFGPKHRAEGFWWHLFGGILALIVGVLILSRPGATAVMITFLLGAFFVAMGVFKTVAAPIEHQGHWGWVMLSGLVSLLVGIWILGAAPAISLWLIGLLVGIEFLVQGLVMIFRPYSAPERRGGTEIYAH